MVDRRDMPREDGPLHKEVHVLVAQEPHEYMYFLVERAILTRHIPSIDHVVDGGEERKSKHEPPSDAAAAPAASPGSADGRTKRAKLE
eukprot:m.62811 g.62811  ORF g.62811 m.62811 type:complete len:88 (+) comp13811_c0_seq1:411-674(+)